LAIVQLANTGIIPLAKSGGPSMPATMHYVRPQNRVKKTVPLRDHVVSVLENYFEGMKGETPENLYNLVLSEVEHPL
jgi:DNA-binding protein Fis